MEETHNFTPLVKHPLCVNVLINSPENLIYSLMEDWQCHLTVTLHFSHPSEFILLLIKAHLYQAGCGVCYCVISEICGGKKAH